MSEHQPIDSQTRIRQILEVAHRSNNHRRQIVAPNSPPGEIFLGHSWDETGQRFETFGIPSEGKVTRSIPVDPLAEINRPK